MKDTFTLDSLRIYLESLRKSDLERFNEQFAASKDAVAAALVAAERAAIKAESAAEKRFDSVNEFRATLKDQQALFVTRTEVYALVGFSTVVATAIGTIASLIGHYTPH